MISKTSKIYLAGHTGLIGSAVLRELVNQGFKNILVKTRKELDLTNQEIVNAFFRKERPDYVILAAAKVGGIKANITYPADFIYENLAIQNNVVWSSYKYQVKKLIYLACGCAYPTKAKQPIKEESLLTGVPEPTNEGFAIAKIAGIKLCEKISQQYNKLFISCIPANTYGIGDHYDNERSHVISALIKKFHLAKISKLPRVEIWGSGNALREFIYVDDIARAIIILLNKYAEKTFINIGSGEEISIKELASLLKKIIGYQGEIVFDKAKPDGMMRRLLDTSKIRRLGFKPQVSLENGLKKAYSYYLENI